MELIPASNLDLFLRNQTNENTRASYSHALGLFQGWLSKPLCEVGLDTALQYRDHLAAHYSAATAQQYLSAVKAFYRMLKDLGVLQINVWAVVKGFPVSTVSTTVALTSGETDKVYASVSGWALKERLVIRLLYEAGLRRAEVAGLHAAALQRGPQGWYLKLTGKGSKEAVVGITDSLAEDLKAQTTLSGGTWVFPGRADNASGHVSLRWVNLVVDRLGPDFHPHRFRHSHTTHALLNGVSLQDVSRTLRHASVQTTMRYFSAIEAVERSSARRVRP